MYAWKYLHGDLGCTDAVKVRDNVETILLIYMLSLYSF